MGRHNRERLPRRQPDDFEPEFREQPEEKPVPETLPEFPARQRRTSRAHTVEPRAFERSVREIHQLMADEEIERLVPVIERRRIHEEGRNLARYYARTRQLTVSAEERDAAVEEYRQLAQVARDLGPIASYRGLGDAVHYSRTGRRTVPKYMAEELRELPRSRRVGAGKGKTIDEWEDELRNKLGNTDAGANAVEFFDRLQEAREKASKLRSDYADDERLERIARRALAADRREASKRLNADQRAAEKRIRARYRAAADRVIAKEGWA